MERIYHIVAVRAETIEEGLNGAHKNLREGLSGQPEGYDWRLVSVVPSPLVNGVYWAIFEGSANGG